MDLNHARLPIPPLRHIITVRPDREVQDVAAVSCQCYKGGCPCQTIADPEPRRMIETQIETEQQTPISRGDDPT